MSTVTKMSYRTAVELAEALSSAKGLAYSPENIRRFTSLADEAQALVDAQSARREEEEVAATQRRAQRLAAQAAKKNVKKARSRSERLRMKGGSSK